MNKKQREKYTKFLVYFIVLIFILGLLPALFR